MPRPADGYRNAADQRVPGVHDITGRFSDKSGLINWAYSQGKKGVPLYGEAAIIGTAVHRMAELDMRAESQREVERVPYGMLHRAEDIDKAIQSFRQYLEWRKGHDVRAIAFEEAIVSERFQYGGTFDIIAWVDGVRSLIDFKTCKTAGVVYPEMRLAMSAHGNLWHEQHPELPLEAYHLIMLPKDGSRFGHHAFADLSQEWEMFTLQLDCWRIEKGLSRRRTAKATKADEGRSRPTKAETTKGRSRPMKADEGRSRPEAPALPPPPMQHLSSWGEMMRAYEHVKEAA